MTSHRRNGGDPAADVHRFAEDPLAFVPLEPGQERLDDPRFVATFWPGSHDWSSSIGRLRLEAGSVESTVEHVRRLVAERGRRSSTWGVGPSATPGDLVERLDDLGLAERDTAEILILDRPPEARPAPGFEVRAVTTLEDHRAALEVAIEGFEAPREDAEDDRSRAEDSFRAEREGGHSLRVLALEDGRPVATGRAWFSPWGAYLGGGATLPTDRGRGAMTTLVAAAWTEAERRGTPLLVTHGGAMSAPMLRRLGFRPAGDVVHLVDRLPDGTAPERRPPI